MWNSRVDAFEQISCFEKLLPPPLEKLLPPSLLPPPPFSVTAPSQNLLPRASKIRKNSAIGIMYKKYPVKSIFKIGGSGAVNKKPLGGARYIIRFYLPFRLHNRVSNDYLFVCLCVYLSVCLFVYLFVFPYKWNSHQQKLLSHAVSSVSSYRGFLLTWEFQNHKWFKKVLKKWQFWWVFCF